MPKPVNPRRIMPPSSRYSHGIIHSARARRLVISGQIGARMDGSIPSDLREQMEVAFDNLLAVIAEAGLVRTDLIKITAFCTEAGGVAAFGEVRNRKLDGHAPASTYLQVAGLALPELRFEIEGEAVTEEPDFVYDDFAETANMPDWSRKR